jgi:hypothetical protein
MKALCGLFIGRVLVLVRSVGPYAAIELLLPGGSMVALLYWWYRRREFPLFRPKRVRGTVLPPSRCGNGHELTPDNLMPAERGTHCAAADAG